jgi:hypothetical protein
LFDEPKNGSHSFSSSLLGDFMRFNQLLKTILAGCFAVMSAHSHAVEVGGVTFTGSGFMTLAAGSTLNGGTPQPNSGFKCPCFISDFAQAGVYQAGRVQWQPDSKLGLQGTATFNPNFSITSQAVLRGAAGGQLDFEWLYGNLKINDQLTLQLGRKRLPLLYFSESQDVGLTYPWIHLAPQIYGWEIVNYNGANLLYRTQWGDWSSSMNLFGGNETVNNSGYWQMYNGRNTRTDSRWSNIAGADLTLNKDWFETRLVYIQSDIQNTNPFSATPSAFGTKTPQSIYGISFNVEKEHWIARSELMYINRKASYGEDFSQVFALGYRIGQFLPMVTYNNYRQAQRLDVAAGLNPNQSEAHSTTSLLVRYDLTNSSALKLQYDHWKNKAQAQFFIANPYTAVPMGTADLISASYDMVF